jgi:hypothetical protein
VGLATLIRRGWRIALFHTVPLAVIFALWCSQYRGAGADDVPGATLRQYLEYAWDLASSPITRLGYVPGVGIVLALAAVVGVVLLARDTASVVARQRYAAAGSCAFGSLLLGLFVARGRAGIPFGPLPTSERFTHLAAALLLPGMAVGLSEVARRWRPFLFVACGLLVAGVPGNIHQISEVEPGVFTLGGEEFLLTVAEAAESSRTPRERRPLSVDAPLVTVGWLRDERARGRIPDPPRSTSPALRARAQLALAVVPADDGRGLTCRAVPPGLLTLRRGDRLVIDQRAVRVSQVGMAGPVATVAFFAKGSSSINLAVEDGPLVVRLEPADNVELCR